MYDYLEQNSNPTLKFPKGDTWALIYADKTNYETKVLVLAVGLKKGELLSNNTYEIRDLLLQLSNRSGVPMVTVIFRTDIDTISEVFFSIGTNKYKKITLLDLAGILKEFRLPVSNYPTEKAINDKSSSAYQNWQRENLGNKIVAVDIDLFKVNANGDILRFYELKRSYYDFSQWVPFKVDYNNFKAMSKLANKVGIEFDIVYNIRTKEPWYDDISRVNIFKVDFDEVVPISVGIQMSIHNFINY